MDKMQFHFVK